ncbi:hypothetical protein GCM10007389_29320 [Pontibacter akesuensis]|nr:hypothetical protein GCM10007389_29320 [Pontibacter akesuensis]
MYIDDVGTRKAWDICTQAGSAEISRAAVNLQPKSNLQAVFAVIRVEGKNILQPLSLNRSIVIHRFTK